MRVLLCAVIVALSSVAMAQQGGWGSGGWNRGGWGNRDGGWGGGGWGHTVTISVRGQGYYPDQTTADAVCRLNGKRGSAGFTIWKQAGDKIQGQRSYDGRPYFQTEVWRGGMALDQVNCHEGRREEPSAISVRGQGFYPDLNTAHAVCALKGYRHAVGYTQWQQAGDKIQGQRSYDGRPYFQTEVWRGGMALDTVTCR